MTKAKVPTLEQLELELVYLTDSLYNLQQKFNDHFYAADDESEEETIANYYDDHLQAVIGLLRSSRYFVDKVKKA